MLYAPVLRNLDIRDANYLRWFSDPDCTQPADFPEAMPDGDLDLYLGYAYQTATFDYVNWNQLEGNYDWDEYDPATGNWRQVSRLISYNAEQEFFTFMYIISAGLPLPEMQTPVKDGMQFAGWHLKAPRWSVRAVRRARSKSAAAPLPIAQIFAISICPPACSALRMMRLRAMKI